MDCMVAHSEEMPSSRHRSRTSQIMLLLFLVASAAVGKVAAFSEEELFVIEKRLQWQRQEAQIERDLPRCRKNEQLCPISHGSDDLHCVDLASAKTCGGCPAENEAIDCTMVPNVFMHGCTSRGQCTGCRWRIGGMNQSLEHPDYLQCSIIKTAPLKRQRKPSWRMPVLSYARVLEKLPLRAKPMAARLRPHGYAAEDSDAQPIVPKKPINRVMVPPKPGTYSTDELIDKNQQLSPALLNVMQSARKVFARPLVAVLDASNLPIPPSWLTTYLSNNLGRLSLTTDDAAVVEWLQGLESAIVKTVTVPKVETEADRRRKKSNAERFRLNLPPIVPADLKQKNKRKPTRAFADDYTDEELEALGWDDLKPVRNEPDMGSALADGPSGSALIWIQIFREVITFKGKVQDMRADVMEAVWLLLDHITRSSGTRVRYGDLGLAAEHPTADRRHVQLVDEGLAVDTNIRTKPKQAGRPILPELIPKQVPGAQQIPQGLRPPGAEPIALQALSSNDGDFVTADDSPDNEPDQAYLPNRQHTTDSANFNNEQVDDALLYSDGTIVTPEGQEAQEALTPAYGGSADVVRPQPPKYADVQAGQARHKPGNNAHGRPVVPKAATYHHKQQEDLAANAMESPMANEDSHAFLPQYAAARHKNQPAGKQVPPTAPEQLLDPELEGSSELSELRDMLAKQAQRLQQLRRLMLNQAAAPIKPAKAHFVEADVGGDPEVPASPNELLDDTTPFEEHLQQINIAKIRHLAKQVQPEISMLERKGVLDAAREIDERPGSDPKIFRPMMAGMAKARPNAHKIPIVVPRKAGA